MMVRKGRKEEIIITHPDEQPEDEHDASEISCDEHDMTPDMTHNTTPAPAVIYLVLQSYKCIRLFTYECI